MMTHYNPKWTASKSELNRALRKNKEYLGLKKGDWRDPDFEQVYKQAMDHGEIDLYETFKGTSAMQKVKAEYYTKPQKKLESIRELKKFKSKSRVKLQPVVPVKLEGIGLGEKGVQMKDFVDRPQKATNRFKISRKSSRRGSQKNLRPVKLKELRLDLTSITKGQNQPKDPKDQTQSRSQRSHRAASQRTLTQRSIPPEESTKTEDLKESIGDNMHEHLDLHSVNEELRCMGAQSGLDQIKRQGSDMPTNQRSERLRLKKYKGSNSRFDLVINKHNMSLFESYIKKITDMEIVFPLFKVDNLKNFNLHSLEDYDTQLDPTVNIEFFIESHRVGKSRWFDKATGKFRWQGCDVLDYDHAGRKFLIRWHDSGAEKWVRRLNLMFEDDNEIEMERRRMKSHFFRCMHLLRLSLNDFITGKQGTSEANLFFSFSRFKNILVKIGEPLANFNKNPEWMQHLEEMFNDFGIAVIEFFIEFKTSKNLKFFLKKFKTNEKARTELEPYMEEVICAGPEDQFELEDIPDLDDVAFFNVPEKAEEDPEEQKVQPASGQKYDMKGIFKPLDFYDLSEADAGAEKMKQRIQVNILKSATNNSFDTHSDGVGSRESSHLLLDPSGRALIRFISFKQREVYEDLAKCKDDQFYPFSNPYKGKYLKSSKNITHARAHLIANSFQPFDIFLFYRTKILEKIDDLKKFNIFKLIENALTSTKNKDNRYPLLEFKTEQAQKSIEELKKELMRIQVEVKFMCDEMEPKDFSMIQFFSKRFKKLIKVVNMLTNDALVQMVQNSAKSLTKILRYMCLGLEYGLPNQKDYDNLLSRTVFVMRHKAMIENKQVPSWMDEVTHPRQLVSQSMSDLRRRITMMEKLILTFAQQIHSHQFVRENLKIEYGRLTPICMYTTVVVGGGGRKKGKKYFSMKKGITYEEKEALRKVYRQRIYNMEEAMEQQKVEIRSRFLDPKTTFDCKTEMDAKYVKSTQFKHINYNVLWDFRVGSNFLSLSPSPTELEESLKKSIERVLSKTAEIPQIKLDRFKTSISYFDFSLTKPSLKKLAYFVDELLMELIIPMKAFGFYLNNFEFLMVEPKDFISHEIKILDEDNNLDPLRNEIKHLRDDFELIYKLPDTLRFGAFVIDITKLKKTITESINLCISSAFANTIDVKYHQLLKENHEKTIELKKALYKDALTIEAYINLKHFLEGPELKGMIKKISDEIELCRQIYDFMSECKVSNEDSLREYLNSLNWVGDLESLHVEATARMDGNKPTFIKEIQLQAEKVFDDFERVEKKVKMFDNYYEPQDCDSYSAMARELSTELTNILKRALEINNKQRILDDDETDFKKIHSTRVEFNKYVELWTFISEKWNVGVERWLKNPFVDLDENEMSETINIGLDLLNRLNEEFEKNEKIKAIISQKLHELDKNQKILDHVFILKDDCFKERHWNKLFDHMKESDKNALVMQKKPDIKKLTLNDLLEIHLLNHTNVLRKILSKAKAEAVIEQQIIKIKKSIEGIDIEQAVFDTDSIGYLNIIPMIKSIIAKLNDHHSICKTMLSNPEYPEEFSIELNRLSRILESTRSVLQIIHTLQNKLIKFSPIFKFNEISDYLSKKDAMTSFLRLREDFMGIMNLVTKRKMDYFIGLVGDGGNERINDLINRLNELNELADYIYENLKVLFKYIRVQCPRYFFLSEEQMLICCSLLKFPKSLMAFVATMFGGVRKVLVDDDFMYRESDLLKLVGLTTKNKEKILFEDPLDISLTANADIPLITIVKGIEKLKNEFFLNARMKHIKPIAKLGFDFKEIWIYARKENVLFQVLILMINLVFDHELMTIFAVAQRNKNLNVYRCLHDLRSMLTKNYSSFQNHPYKYMKDSFRNPEHILFFNQYILFLKYFEEKLTYLIDAGVHSFVQFEFLSLPKYTISYNSADIDIYYLTKMDHIDTFLNTHLDISADRVLKKYGKRTLLSSSSPVMNIFYGHQHSKVTMNVMDMSFNYQNEFVTYNRNLAIWPICERSMLSIFTALHMKMNLIIKGFSNHGKTETIRIISNLLATNYIECETRVHLNPDTMINLLSGVISGGYWLLIKNMERCSFSTLSILATYVNTIKNNILLNKNRIVLGANELIINHNYAIFSTFRVMSDAHEKIYNSLPLNLLDSFRTIPLVKPNYSTIIEHLVTFIMSRDESRMWSNKVILFAKMLKNVENFDYLLDKKERIESAIELGKETTLDILELDLKLVSFFIYVATVFYFGRVDDFYGKYDTEAKYVYMSKDKKKIKIEFNQRAVFTGFFKFTFNLFMKKRGVHSTRLKLFNKLFDKIFEEEIAINPKNTMPKFAWQMDEVFSKVEIYLKYKPYHFGSLDIVKQDVQQYVELLTRDPHGRQYIIYGKPDSQKSKFLKLLGFLESNIKKINFGLFWFNLECLDDKTVFGSDKFVGILKELFLHCHNMNNEEKITNTKKLNNLFQSNAELFYHFADFRPSKDLKKTKVLDRGASWVIIDANSSKHNTSMFELLQKMQEVVSTLNEHRIVNQYLGFSRRLRFFYEVNNLSRFDPKSLVDNHLIYLKNAIVPPSQIIKMWFGRHSEESSFFLEIQSLIFPIWKLILMPYLDFIEEMHREKQLLYYTSKISILNNFMSFNLIFLNELRKYLVIHELLGEKSKYKFADKKKDDESEFNFSQTNALQEKLNRMAKSQNGLSFISNMRTPMSKRKEEKNQVKGIKTEEDRVNFIKRKLEALTIFCITCVIRPIVLEPSQERAKKALINFMDEYLVKNHLNQMVFADGVYKIVTNMVLGDPTDIADYKYNLTTGNWEQWEHIKLNHHKTVTPSLTQTKFDKSELERLNCKNQKTLFHPLTKETSDLEFIKLDETSLVSTKTANKMYYLTDLLFAYNQNIVLMSDHQQGKSVIVQSIIRKMVEQKRVISFNFGMQKSMGLETVQRHIEDHLLKQGGNIIAPPLGKKVIIWLDDLNLSVNDSRPESLVRSLQVQNGWFSLNRCNFTKVNEAFFVMTLSFQEENSKESKRVIDSVNLDILAKCSVLKTPKMHYGEFATIFNEIVKETISFDQKGLDKVERLLASFYKQLAKIVYFNKDTMINLSKSNFANLNISDFIQFGKSLNMIQWESVNQEEYMTQLVWLKLLKGYVQFNFPLVFNDLRKIVQSKKSRAKLGSSEAPDKIKIETSRSELFTDGEKDLDSQLPALQTNKDFYDSKASQIAQSHAEASSNLSLDTNELPQDQNKGEGVVRMNTTAPKASGLKSPRTGLSKFARQQTENTKQEVKPQETLILGEEDNSDGNSADEEKNNSGAVKIPVSGGMLPRIEESPHPNTETQESDEKEQDSGKLTTKKGSGEVDVDDLIAQDLERNKTLGIDSPDFPIQNSAMDPHLRDTLPSIASITEETDDYGSKGLSQVQSQNKSGAQTNKRIIKRRSSIKSETDDTKRYKKLKQEKLEPLTLNALNKLQEIKELEDSAGEEKEDQSLSEYAIETEKGGEKANADKKNLERMNTGRKSNRSKLEGLSNRGSPRNENRHKNRIELEDEGNGEDDAEDNQQEKQTTEPGEVAADGVNILAVNEANEADQSFIGAKSEASIKQQNEHNEKEEPKVANKAISLFNIQNKLESIGAKKKKEGDQEDQETPSDTPRSHSGSEEGSEKSKNPDPKEKENFSISEEDSRMSLQSSSTESSNIDEEEELKLKETFTLKRGRNLRQFMTKFLQKAVIEPAKLSTLDNLDEACIFNRFIMFDLSTTVMLDASMNKDDENLFSVVDSESEQRVMSHLKNSLTNFIYFLPEALYALKLNGCNFSNLINDMNRLHLNLVTKHQHLIVSCFKALQYTHYLTYFVARNIARKFFYIDLTKHESYKEAEEQVQRFNSYEYLLQIIFENFGDIWADHNLIIMIHISNKALAMENELTAKLLGLVDSIVSNTDLMLSHFGDRIKKMLRVIKNETLYSHFPENHLIYMFRNKLQSKISFVLANECSRTDLLNTKLDNLQDKKPTLRVYLNENYPRMYSRLKKICINGMLIGGDDDIPYFYEKVTPLSDATPSMVFMKGYKIQINFLRILDKDFEFVNFIRPLDQSMMLYEQIIRSLYNQFEVVENETETQGILREQLMILQRIKRRNEILKLEEKEILNLLKMKNEERDKILNTKAELLKNRAHFIEEKEKVEEKLEALKKKIGGYQKEDKIYSDLEKNLSEATQNITKMPEREFIKHIKVGKFFNSKIFSIYAIIFHEIFKIEVKNRFTQKKLEKLSEKNINLADCEDYIISFSQILEDFTLLKSYLNYYSGKRLITKEKVVVLGEIIQRSDDLSFLNMNKTQKNMMKWIDLLIEWTRFGISKEDRESKIKTMTATVEKVQNEISKRDNIVVMIDDSLKEQPGLLKTVEEKIGVFKEKKTKVDFGKGETKKLFYLLQSVHEKYTKISAAFKSKDMNRNTMIELLASYIVFWNHYPYNIKKSLFFAQIKSLKQKAKVFNETPIFQILGTEQLLLEALKSKVPFNVNFLNNVAVAELIQKSLLPYPVVYDPSGLYLRWLRAKHPKFLQIDYYSPERSSRDNIQNCLVTGHPFLAVDPNEEMLKLLHPLIEWKFKQFCQSVIKEFEEQNEEDVVIEERSPSPGKLGGDEILSPEHDDYVSPDVVFNGRKIVVKQGFRLYIVFEKTPVEEIDEALLMKILFINNEVNEKRIWKETLKDDLVLEFNPDDRAVVVEEYLNLGMITKIHEKYRQLNGKLKGFDFLTDDLTSGRFSDIMKLTVEIDDLTNQFEEQNQRRIDELEAKSVDLQEVAQDGVTTEQGTLKETLNGTEQGALAAQKGEVTGSMIKKFMNYDYSYKVTQMDKLTKVFEPLAERFYIYHKLCNKLGPFFGINYFGTQEVLLNRIKQVVDIYKFRLQVDYFKSEDRDKKFIEDESDEENARDLRLRFEERNRAYEEEMGVILVQMERLLYFMIVNSVPLHKRFIISFSLGVLYHTNGQKPGAEAQTLIDQLRILLFSEKLMPKHKRMILLSNNVFYDKFNGLFGKINRFYSHLSSNLPQLMDSESSFEMRLKEIEELQEKLDSGLTVKEIYKMVRKSSNR